MGREENWCGDEKEGEVGRVRAEGGVGRVRAK